MPGRCYFRMIENEAGLLERIFREVPFDHRCDCTRCPPTLPPSPNSVCGLPRGPPAPPFMRQCHHEQDAQRAVPQGDGAAPRQQALGTSSEGAVWNLGVRLR